MKNLKDEIQVKEAIKEIKSIASKFGVRYTRTAIRRWDKGMSEKTKLLKEKKELEQALSSLKRKLS